MPVSCAAEGCTNRFVKGSSIRFYRFPISRPTLAAQWVQNLGRKSFAPTSNTCLCSEHFLPECFRDYNGRQFLREDAVPTIFRPPQPPEPETSETEPRALRGGATAKEPGRLKRQRFGAMSELEKAQEREKARLRQRERRLRLKEMSAASFTEAAGGAAEGPGSLTPPCPWQCPATSSPALGGGVLVTAGQRPRTRGRKARPSLQ